jgi:hypothetical protein
LPEAHLNRDLEAKLSLKYCKITSKPVTPASTMFKLISGFADLNASLDNNSITIYSSSQSIDRHRPTIRYQSKLSEINIDRLKLAIKRHNSSFFGKNDYGEVKRLNLNDIKTAFKLNDLEEPSPANWNKLATACIAVQPNELFELLSQIVIPRVCDWRPNASITIVQHHFGLHRYFTVHKLLRIFSHIPRDSVNAPTESLMHWATGSPDQIFGSLLDWSSWIFFPRSHTTRMTSHGLDIIFNDDSLNFYKPAQFPVSILEMQNGSSHFGRGDPHLSLSKDSVQIRSDHYFGRRIWQSEVSMSMRFNSWIITRASDLIVKMADPISFATPDKNSGGLAIDSDRIQLYTWTIERIIKRTLSIQTTESRNVDVFLVFEIADMIGKLRALLIKFSDKPHVDTQESMWLFRADSCELVAEIVSAIPHPWGKIMSDVCRDVYSECFESANKSVWDRPRARGDAVDISPLRDGSSELKIDEFFSQLMRLLRNSSHGYFHGGSHAMIQTISNGDVGKSVMFLPSLWLLALLADPARFIGLR